VSWSATEFRFSLTFRAFSSIQDHKIGESDFETLESFSKDSAASIPASWIAVLERCINSWPVDKIFPLVDLLRILAAREDGRRQLDTKPSFFLKFIIMIKTKVALGSNLSVLMMRFFSNLLATDTSATANKMMGQIVDVVDVVLTHDAQKAAKLAASVVLLKFGFFQLFFCGLSFC
jgi:hypothetical protein